MTVAAEIAKDSVKLEYALAIEGYGWPVDEADLSQGFNGRVFVTTDVNGTGTTDWGSESLTVGLRLPSSISSSFHVRTMEYQRSGSSFSIIDTADYFLTNFTPNRVGGDEKEGTLNASISWMTTTVQIDNATTSWATGDTIWVSHSEAIKLGTKTLVAGTVYNYTGSTRGYLGTPIGNRGVSTVPNTNGAAFITGTKIRNFNRYWYDRRVALYCKVPGESAGNIVALYRGRLRDFRLRDNGTEVDLTCAYDVFGEMQRYRADPGYATIKDQHFQDSTGRMWHGVAGAPVRGGSDNPGSGSAQQDHTTLPSGFETSHRRYMKVDGGGGWGAYLGVALAYRYRMFVKGGTIGLRSTLISSTPQAYQDANNKYILGTLLNVGGQYLYARHKREDDGTATYPSNHIICDVNNYDLGNNYLRTFDVGAPVRFLLHNIMDVTAWNRFTMNGRVTRHPIDVMLAFFTSFNSEWDVRDCTAGSTTTVVNFSTASYTNDEWIGYALHKVTGTGASESRLITDNTATSITVDYAFSGVSTGDQFHIRNTQADVLPFSWGMQIHHSKIDWDSFMVVRRQLGGAQLGKFALGDGDTIDLWGLIRDNICVPYNILLYRDQFDGKLSAKHINDVGLQDGIDSSYPALGPTNIIRIGDISYLPRAAARRLVVKTRATAREAIKPIVNGMTGAIGGSQVPNVVGYAPVDYAHPSIHSKGATITVNFEEDEDAFRGGEHEEIEVSAMFHQRDNINPVLERMYSRLAREATPWPEVKIDVDISLLATVQPGVYVSLTDTTKYNPPNPFTGSRGWTALVGLVTSTTITLSGKNPGLSLTVALMPSITGARVAPAAIVYSKGNDAGGDYFVMHTAGQPDLNIDTTETDWDLFRVDDRIELRTKTGALVEAEVIKGFGSNLATLPEDANDNRIYVDGTISAAISGGDDYITFGPWSNANTTNMDLYAAYADSNEQLGTANDPAREYA